MGQQIKSNWSPTVQVNSYQYKTVDGQLIMLNIATKYYLTCVKLAYNQNKKQPVPNFYKESSSRRDKHVTICDPKLNNLKVVYQAYFI
jgi:hypothetical protein